MSSREQDFEDDNYAIPIKSYRKKSKKCTKEQHIIYVDFLEKHPKLWDEMHKNYQRHWNELAELLNKKGPRKNPDQWQTNLRDWRYAVKFKYRRSRENGKSISDIEMKLLKVLGIIGGGGSLKEKPLDTSDEDCAEQPLQNEEMSEDPLMEEEQIDEVVIESAAEDDAHMSPGWVEDVKKEVTEDCKTPTEGVTAVRWSEKSIQYLLGYVKVTIDNFEQPNPQTYYSRFLQRKPPIERNIGNNWYLVQNKMTDLRKHYRQTLLFFKEKLGTTIVPKNISSGLKTQLLIKCPYFFELDNIFGKKDQPNSTRLKLSTNPKMPPLILPPRQIPIRVISPNKPVNTVPGSSRMPFLSPRKSDGEELERSLELEKIDVEIRRFELQKKRYEHKKQLERQKFLFESDMRKQELELHRQELENERRKVENMVQMEKLRLELEERTEKYRIQMQYSSQ